MLLKKLSIYQWANSEYLIIASFSFFFRVNDTSPLKKYNHLSFSMVFNYRAFTRHSFFLLLGSYPFLTLLHPSLHYHEAFNHLSFYVFSSYRALIRHTFLLSSRIIPTFDFSKSYTVQNCTRISHFLVAWHKAGAQNGVASSLPSVDTFSSLSWFENL